MKAALLVESLTGNTWKAAEEIGSYAVHFREIAQARAEVHALLKSN